MKPRHRYLLFTGRRALAAASLFFVFEPAHGVRAQQAAVNPFTYLGRVMDASHKAFDEDRSATVSAYGADGKELAKAETSFREGSRNNYRLLIPLADGEADGYATPGAILSISVDDGTKVWSGIVVDEGRVSGTAVGAPGGVREVDIVLGEDKDGDGIDDTLFGELKEQWAASDYCWNPANETFDPNADHDGDGVSTINEALAGTNPFKESSVLSITAFDMATEAEGRHVLTFSPTMPGRAYVVQTADSPTGTWSSVSFQLPDSATPVNVISRTTTASAEPATVYLLPSDKPAAFFRVKLDGDTDSKD